MKRRSLALRGFGCLAAACIITGCIGDSDDAAYITASSALLRGHGKCNNSLFDATHGNCFHFWQIREKGSSTWLSKPASSNCPTASAPSIDNGIPNDASIVWNLSCSWTNLSANTIYEFQFCGGDAGSSANGTFHKIPDEQLPDGLLINSTADWKGAGHGGIVADVTGRLWWVYHSTSPSGTLHFRQTMVQQIFWDPSSQWFFFENNSIKASAVGVPSH